MLIELLLCIGIAAVLAYAITTPMPGTVDDRRSMWRWRHARRALDRVAPINRGRCTR